ncbi:MAG TPA: hypothetical protein VGI43_15190 [Mucilaginibacter sp.]|jgi:tetratricopeptide (TPR) repeat protein
MKKSFIFVILLLFAFIFIACGESFGSNLGKDTDEVIKLNKQGFLMRLTDPDQTIAYAKRALMIAQRIDYKKGIGESYRIMGIAYYYLDRPVASIDNYLNALDYFQQIKDLQSEGSIYNNIGNLYINSDPDRALYFFQKALTIAKSVSNKPLIAKAYFNLGAAYYWKSSMYQALNYYNKSDTLFNLLKDSVNLVQCMQNRGVIYYTLNDFKMSESLLLGALKRAKASDLNKTVASIDVTLSDIYIKENRFRDAEESIKEGKIFAKMVKSEKNQFDFVFESYQLEVRRKNYEKALILLREIYHRDSLEFTKGTSGQLFNLFKEQVNRQAQQREREITLQRQQYDRVKFWSVALMAGLLAILVGVLVSNVKRKARTNTQLTNLNSEVSRQKDNLDRINHHLEEIIDERTKDLQIKNKKLSEYSSYLSHQIRGPIATLKGLLNLEKEGLVDQPECIKMMNKSVSDIDDKIIEMSDMLHDPGRTGF